MLNTSIPVLVGTAYLGGLLSFFSPCIFPVIPVYLSMLSINGEKSLKRTLLFIVGLSVTFLVLGLGLGSIGSFLFNDTAKIIAGIIIILMGLLQSEIFNWEKLNTTKTLKQKFAKDSEFAPFLLGLTFSIGWTPCVGPILASILLLSGTSGSMMTSLAMMFAYMLGIATPFLLFTFASKHLLSKLNIIKPHLNTLKKAGGYLMIIMGILLATNQINLLANSGGPTTTETASAPTPAVQQHTSKLNLSQIQLTDINGKPVDINQYKGKKLYIKLWASWCPECRASLPDTAALAADTNKDFTVLTIVFPNHFRERSPEGFKQWYQQMNYPNMPVLYNNDAQLAEMIKLHAFPTSLLVDENLNIIRVLPGSLTKDMIEYVFDNKQS